MTLPAPRRHAVVVGGGIGGLAVAAGLHRAGWTVTVLERAAEPREAGSGISLLTNAQRALDQLGVGEAVRERSATMIPGGEGLRRPSGRWLLKPLDPATFRSAGLSTLVLTRRELHGILRRALPPGTLRTGAEVIAVNDVPDGVSATYRGPRGEEIIEGQALIAADGAHSTIRRLRWPLAPSPVYSGHSVWRGIAEVSGRGAEPGGNTWGLGLEFGRMPLPGDLVYWFAVANTPAGARYADNHEEVRNRFGGWHDPIPALVAATPALSVLHHDVIELAEPLGTYASGRVALLGDAAHVMTSDLGQGACQALEDAVVLCAELAAAADPAEALARYDEQRRPRSQGIAAASHRMGQLKLEDRPMRARIRDATMRLTPRSSRSRGVVMVADWHPPELPVMQATT